MKSFKFFEAVFSAYIEMRTKGIQMTVINGISAISKKASEYHLALGKADMQDAVLTMAGIASRAKYYE